MITLDVYFTFSSGQIFLTEHSSSNGFLVATTLHVVFYCEVFKSLVQKLMLSEAWEHLM